LFSDQIGLWLVTFFLIPAVFKNQLTVSVVVFIVATAVPNHTVGQQTPDVAVLKKNRSRNKKIKLDNPG
jgi:hypothetical protein